MSLMLEPSRKTARELGVKRGDDLRGGRELVGDVRPDLAHVVQCSGVVVQAVDGQMVAGGNGPRRTTQFVIDPPDAVDIRGGIAEPVPSE
jgi:hypothetical protein